MQCDSPAELFVQDDAEEGTIYAEAAILVNVAELRIFFMKRFTRERVVPIISARFPAIHAGSASRERLSFRSGRGSAGCGRVFSRSN